MTLTYTAEQVRELVLADARRKNPGVLIGTPSPELDIDELKDREGLMSWVFAGYTVPVLDQSPFGISQTTQHDEI